MGSNYVTGAGVILATTDGGATWSVQGSGAAANTELNGVAFANAGDGWAVGYNFMTGRSVILATTNGGSDGVTVPQLTLQLSGLKSGALKLGKRLTAKGTATPTSLAGGKVTLTVQRKHHGKWRKAAGTARTISARGAYRWKYQPAKRGSYRLRATIAGTAGNTAATTRWKTFKVK